MHVSGTEKLSSSKLLLIGLVLIMLGSCIAGSLAYFKPDETVAPHSFNLTTKDVYFNSYTVWGGEGYWFNLNITTDGPSILRVKGDVVGDFYTDQGTTYKYSVSLPQGDVYMVQVENCKRSYNGSAWVTDEINIVGDWQLNRSAEYVTPLNVFSWSFDCCRHLVFDV